MAKIKRAFKTFNGSSWDTCYFDTDESQIVTGFQQNIDNIADNSWHYKKMPGGMVIAWARVKSSTMTNSPVSGDYSIKLNFPFTFAYPPKVLASGFYALGLPKVAVHEIAITHTIIGSANKLDGLFIEVLAIGKVA